MEAVSFYGVGGREYFVFGVQSFGGGVGDHGGVIGAEFFGEGLEVGVVLFGDICEELAKARIGGDSAGGEEGTLDLVFILEAAQRAFCSKSEALHDAFLEGEGEGLGCFAGWAGIFYIGMSGECGFES